MSTMEYGISMLNKIKEVQNITLNLKKISNEIYDETTTKVKEVNFYNEQIKSQKAILIKCNIVRAQLNSENAILDQNIAAWKAILDNKKQNLEIEKKEVERLKNGIFLARINYCDSVFKFLSENVNLEDDSPFIGDTELESLRAKSTKLEQELDILDTTIRNKKSTEFSLLLGQKMKAEEVKCEKLLEDKKNKLRNLVKEIRTKKQKHANMKSCPENFVEVTVATVSNVTHKRWAYSAPKNSQSDVQTQQRVHRWPVRTMLSSASLENKKSQRFTQSYCTDLLKKYSDSIGQRNDFVKQSANSGS